LSSYENVPNRDTILYQLARAYDLGGQPEKALTTLDTLIAKYPKSIWIPEAYFRRGESLFSRGLYADSEVAYQGVLGGGPDTGFYDQALYKQGWSLYKQGRVEESIVSFLRMLNRQLDYGGILREDESLSRAEKELADDALRVLALIFASVEGAETLNATLYGYGQPVYTHKIYAALGDLYLEQERYQDAAQVFEQFSATRTESRYAPTLQLRAIDAYRKGGFQSLVLQGKVNFVEQYAFGGPFWSARRREDAPEVVDELKSTLSDLAQYYRSEAQKNKKTEDFAAAARWYRRTLEDFPNDPVAADTRYALAQTLFESAQFGEAAREYEATAYEYPTNANSAEAGYAAIIAYEKYEASVARELKAGWKQQRIDSQVKFANTFPQHPQAGIVLTKTAEELFEGKQYYRTIEVAQRVLDRDPPMDPKRQRIAATLVANSLFELERFGPAEQAYLKAQELVPAGDPERKLFADRIAASIYKQAELKQKDGDKTGAIDDFLRVGLLAPSSATRANAEFDAATLLITNGQWARAAEVLEGFRRNNPNHELSAEVTRNLAASYLELNRNGEAAVEFEKIGRDGKEDMQTRRAALLQAAGLYEKAGQMREAGGVYTTYVQLFPMPLDSAMEARQKLADMAKANNDSAARIRWLDEIIRADKTAGDERTNRTRYLAALATVETVTPALAAFDTVKLVSPLAKSLKEKRKAMEKVLGIYGQALDYQVAEVTTAATFGMAELYSKLGKEVMASERPLNLDADALEQYNVLLEEQAFPLEERAIELHEANSRRASEGIYDKWVKQSYESLAKLKPARYGKTEIGESYVPTLP
jgi:tetratricopeptide (TPR) repeat protein